MGCGKSKLDVVGNATISKSKSKSVSKKQKDEGSAQVAKDVKTVSDKVESGNKVEIAVAPQQTGGGSEKIEDKTEKPEEESPVAGAGDVEAGNAGAEDELDVDKKDDSNSLKIEGEPTGATKIVFIEPVVDVEKPKDVVEAKAPIVEEKAHVEETKTETIKEAPEIATEKEAEAVPAVQPEASTPTPPEASAAPAEETETVAVPVKPEAAEEQKETEAVASPVQPEVSAVPAEEKKETEEASAAEEQEKAPAGEETVAPTAESPAADTKTD